LLQLRGFQLDSEGELQTRKWIRARNRGTVPQFGDGVVSGQVDLLNELNDSFGLNDKKGTKPKKQKVGLNTREFNLATHVLFGNFAGRW
jgi:hypothetical protein